MDPEITKELMNAGKVVATGFAVSGGLFALVTNGLSYASTLSEFRKQESSSAEEFQEKCDQYWRQPIARDDLGKIDGAFGKMYMNVFWRPGLYLACRYLSIRGK